MIALYFVLGIVGATAYVCAAVKVGFVVLNATEDTGFGVGFYAITVMGILALPIGVGIRILVEAHP